MNAKISCIISLLFLTAVSVLSCTEKYKMDEQLLQVQVDHCKRLLDGEIAKGKKLQQQLSDLQSLRGAEKNNSADMKKQIDGLNRQLSDEKARAAGLQKQIEALNSQISAQKAEALNDQKSSEAAYQQLLKSLQNEIKNNEITIQQYKDVVAINIAERVLFDLGRAEIKSKYLPILDKIGKILKGQSDKFIQIEGHTDDIPIATEYQWKIPNNWALGARRAINVTTYFIDRFNIDPQMIGVMSFSKYRPLYPNISAANRAKNRRIEIILLGRALYRQIYRKGI